MIEINQAYLDVLKSCIIQFENMIEHEKKKRQALLDSNESDISSMLQAQQAELMQLESLEKKRLEQHRACGCTGLSATEVVEKIEDENMKTQFKALIDRLNETTKELRELNGISLDIARTNMKMADAIFQNERTGGDYGVYKPKADVHKEWASGSVFEEKV